MKFLTIVTPRGTGGQMPSPELFAAAKQWIDSKRADGTFECVYSFVEGGGVAIGEADSLEELQRDIMSYPMTPMVAFEVRPLVSIDDTFRMLQERATAMAAQQA